MTSQELVHRIGRRVKVKPESGLRAFEKPMRVSGVKEGWGELCAILIPDDEIVLTRTQYERKTVDVTASNLERDYQPLTEEQAQQLKPGQKLQLCNRASKPHPSPMTTDPIAPEKELITTPPMDFTLPNPTPERSRGAWVPEFNRAMVHVPTLKNNTLRKLERRASHPAWQSAARAWLNRRINLANGTVFVVSKTAAEKGRTPFGLPAGVWRLSSDTTAVSGELAPGQPKPIWLDNPR